MNSDPAKIALSKTSYILYRRCKKNTWLKIHRPDIYYKFPMSEFEQHLMETGIEVELSARNLFPGGVLIDGTDREAREKTIACMRRKDPIIFQPALLVDNFFAALDVLKYDPTSDSYSIYEIKSTSGEKEDHYYDLAFQVNLIKKFAVANNMRINLSTMYLIHLNSKYIRNGPLDLTELFAIADATEPVSDILDRVAEEMDLALTYLSQPTEPAGPCSCLYKNRGNHCSTFQHSNSHVPEYSVHDIARISRGKLEKLVDGNILRIDQVHENFSLTEIQKNQVEAEQNDRTLVDGDRILSELSKLEYPIYFLDYETFPCAIPRFNGFSPHQQMPFQHSLHILDSPADLKTETLRHVEFIYLDSGDPTRAFTESLRMNLGPRGSIVVWHRSFEAQRNEELAYRLPEMKSFLDDVNSRLYDLKEIFSQQYYVHKGFRGSASIKRVLPVLIPELSYTTLAIQEGSEALRKWDEMTMGHISQEEKERIASNLLEYCKLDSFAMYAIFRKLSSPK